MRGLEEGKVTPARYIMQLAKETIGLGAAQRMYNKVSKDSTFDRADVLITSTSAGISQVGIPMLFADLLSTPRRELSNLELVHVWGLALAAFTLDLGIDAMAIIMAVNGNIDAAIGTKLGYNAAAPIIADKIRPHLSDVVFQKTNKLNSL